MGGGRGSGLPVLQQQRRHSLLLRRLRRWIEGTMSDVSQGPGWWQASDLKWYPPELQGDYVAPLPPPPKLPPPPPSATDPAAQQRSNDLNLAATQRHPEALPS